MPTLNAMFRLMDGYSTQIKKIIENTDKAAAAILGASKKTDHYNESLKKTETTAARANSSLSRLLRTAVSFAAVQKGMDLADTYINTKSRLGMITSSPKEQAELQRYIFASANRSRGSYTDMANAVAKMRMLAGDSFTSNQEAASFTELLTKSLKVSGASQSEQNSAFLQLTQAIAAGKLQGDEFRSIMENAPMVADAIAQYMGKTKGELKELSSEGRITSDIIKNAMFQAADDINGKFNGMPMTFADVWQKIKNAGMQAFGGVFEKANAMLNSSMGQSVINNLTGAIYMAAEAANFLLDGLEFVGQYLDIFGPLVLGVAGAFAFYYGILLLTKGAQIAAAVVTGAYTAVTTFLSIGYGVLTGNTAAASAAQFVYNSALLACPLTWVIGGIIVLIGLFYAGVAAVNHFAGTSISATGLIGSAFYMAWAFIYNHFIFPLQKSSVIVANFIGNVFNNPVAAVKMLFLDMANTCIDYVLNMARAIENIINKIPGVTVNITSGLEGLKTQLESKTSVIKDESGWKEYVKQPKLLDYSEMAVKGYNAGKGLIDKASNLFSGFNPNLDNLGSRIDFDQFATSGNPATVKGTGQGGAVKVESEEDISWMRKLAERDYVARIAQNTLAPNIKVEFNGPITKEADTDNVVSHVVERFKEVIATAPEGVPE